MGDEHPGVHCTILPMFIPVGNLLYHKGLKENRDPAQSVEALQHPAVRRGGRKACRGHRRRRRGRGQGQPAQRGSLKLAGEREQDGSWTVRDSEGKSDGHLIVPHGFSDMGATGDLHKGSAEKAGSVSEIRLE